MSETVYHGSKNLFDKFTMDKAGRCENATNGALGIWITPDVELAGRFSGSNGVLYELSVKPGEIKRLTVKWLADVHERAQSISHEKDRDAAISFYEHMRQEFIAQGYSELWIGEKDGTYPTRIVLDPDLIEIKQINLITEQNALAA